MNRSMKLIFLVIVLFCVVPFVQGSIQGSSSAGGGPRTVASIQPSAVPVGFIANTGAQDPSVLFLARPPGSTIFITRDGVVITREVLSGTDQDGSPQHSEGIISLSVEGADPASVDAIDPMSGSVNMIMGSDPAAWKSGIPVYGAIRYSGILPGIDHVYRANGGTLKREFDISPGADPSAIILHYGGVSGISTDKDGALLLTTPLGVLREAPPVCYQDSDDGKVPVTCRYVINGNDSVSFKFGPYDRSRTLVVDPELTYSTFLGGSSDDAGYAIAVDEEGYIYVTGSTDSTNFPTRSAFKWSKQGWTDIFVTKFNPETSKLVYSTYIGGRLDDVAYAITLGDGPDGPRAYITGYTGSDNFPLLNPIDPDQVVMNPDVFVTALEANGATLYFSTLLAGSRSDYGRAIRLDNLGNVWVTGYTYSCDFVPDSPPYIPFQEHPNLREVCPGGTWCCVIGADAFLAEVMYDETVPATTLEYCTYISGYDDDKGYALTFDADGDPVVAGTTGSPNFPMVNPYQGNLQGYTDAFVTVLDIGDLSQALFSTYFGGSGDEEARGVAIVNNRIAIAGTTDSPDLPVESACQGFLAGEKDAFLTIFNEDETDLDYSTYYGGSYSEHVDAMATTPDPEYPDNPDKIYIGGYTRSHDFPISASIKDEMLGFQDGFITMFYLRPDYDTSTPLVPTAGFSTFLGGDLGDDQVTGLALDGEGNIYATGLTGATDFPLAPEDGTYQGKLRGFQDAFITKFTLVPPEADFEGEPTKGVAPLLVSFTDLSTNDPLWWNWTFGDGSHDHVQDPVHKYVNIGNYSVNLTVCNADGCANISKEDYIKVGARPVANFTVNSTLNLTPLCIKVTDNSTGNVTDWHYNYGNGTWYNTTDSALANFTTCYTTPGIYNMTLKVCNAFECNTTAPVTLTAGQIPVANFTANRTAGAPPLSVSFNDTSIGYPAPTSFTWDFGNGVTNSSRNTTYTFTSTGTYNVSLNATNIFGSNTSPNQTISVGLVPMANFTADATLGLVPFTVNFTDLSTNSPKAWNWSLGDGSFNTSQNVTKVYTTAGLYDVSLNATNVHGSNTSVKKGYITAGTLPVADFLMNTTSGAAPLTVNFTDNSSGFPAPTSFSWDFNGVSNTSRNVTYTFAAAGTYNISLNVTNVLGWNRTANRTVTVGPVPVADFTATPLAGPAPLNVTFTSISSGSPSTLNWSFGDGVYGNGQTVQHTYTYAGNYTVNLTATNAYGSNTTSKAKYISPHGGPRPVSLLYFVPPDPTIPTGMTRAVRMYLNRTATGMGGYNFTLSYQNISVGLFSTAAPPSWSPSPAYSGILPAASISLIGIDINSTVGIGQTDVPLGTVSLTGSTPGKTNLTLTGVTRFEDQFTNPVDLATSGAGVTVGTLLPVPGYSSVPHDLNGDWLFEDVNGDGRYSFADLIAFFQNLEWMADNEPYALFDFDGNHRANFGDIIAAFHLL